MKRLNFYLNAPPRSAGAMPLLLTAFITTSACSDPQDLTFLDDLTDASAGSGDAGSDAALDSCEDGDQLGEVCSSGQGACERAGSYVCEDGMLSCSALPGSPSDELCDSERDEDCDGVVDEAPEGGCCSTGDCEGLFVCERDPQDALAPGACVALDRPNSDCVKEDDAIVCTCKTGFDGDGETCVRNACVPLDGEDPACAPNQSCEPTEPGQKTCTCEPGFDDCDLEVGNGCEQALDASSHCGACGNACDARASCSDLSDERRCVCDRPLIGEGKSCIGYGPISAGGVVTCGIRVSGAIECFPASAPTPPTGTFKQLALGQDHHCALSADSSVACWGNSSSGALNVPTDPPNQDYVQVVVGNFHTCALKMDGSPVCWGISQTNPGSYSDYGQSMAPAERFHQLTAGGYHSCGLLTDGSVHCWGAGLTQEAGCPQMNAECGQSIPPDAHFVQLTAGLYHSCGLRADGTVTCWGAGATDDNAEDSPNWGQSMVPSGAQFTFISAGGFHTCGVRTDRKIACWGAGQADAAGQIPNDFAQSSPPASDFLRVASGALHTCGLTNVNQVRCWGGLNPSELPQPSTTGTWPVNP